MIGIDDFLLFTRRTVTGMLAAVDRIGDERINQRPELPGLSTPFQLVTHAFAAAEFWCAHIVCGRPTERVRDEEFLASGSVAELRAAAAGLLAVLVILDTAELLG